MTIIPELKKIASLNAKKNRLAEIVAQKIGDGDTDGIDITEAYLVSGCSVKDGHLYHNDSQLDNCGLVDDLYFCKQYTGYLEDDYYGTLYFKTDVPGQFVAVPFAM